MRGRGIDWYRRPEIILGDLIVRAARGEGSSYRGYRRAAVVAVDVEGGLLQNRDGTGGIDVVDRTGRSRHFPAIVGPENPRCSVKARVLTDGLDRLLSDDDLRVFWPLLSPDQLSTPVSPGEHVYVFFEGAGMDHGVWVARVPGQDSANSFQGSDSYTAPSAPRSGMDSFEPNDPQYETTDDHAGLAESPGGMSFFDGSR